MTINFVKLLTTGNRRPSMSTMHTTNADLLMFSKWSPFGLGATFLGLYIAHKLWHVLLFCYVYIRPKSSVKLRYGSDHSNNIYAVVTGAGSGIGLEIVCKLLEDNVNVIAVSLPIDRKNFISRTGNLVNQTKCHFVGIDILDGVTKAVEKVLKHVKEIENIRGEGIDGRILINCVGISNNFPKLFVEHSSSEIKNLMDINLNFTLCLTNSILNSVLNKNKQRGVVFVSSQAGALPGSPLVPLYGCGKAALIHFAKTLQAEEALSNENNLLDVMVAIPGYVNSGKTPAWINLKKTTTRSNNTKKGNFGLGVASPKYIAHSILGNLGYGYPVVLNPYFVHGIQFALLKLCFPESLVQRLSFNELNPVRINKLNEKKRS